MRPSRWKKETRSVFDVHAASRGDFFTRIRNIFFGRTIDLKPKYRVRHPWITGAFTLALVALATVGFNRLFVRAEVEDFYPSTCLGTWQSVESAQGKPEMLTPPSASTTFSDNNSALFLSGNGQIFCGGFVPSDYEAKGEIKNVGLT